MRCFIEPGLLRLLGQFVTYPLDIVRRRMQMYDPSKAVMADGSISTKVPGTRYCRILLVSIRLGFQHLAVFWKHDVVFDSCDVM
jgi:hypothetical protein